MKRDKRAARLEKIIVRTAAKYFNDRSVTGVLLTVADCDFHWRADRAVLYLSIYPDNQARSFLIWARNEIGGLRYALGKATRLKTIPEISLELKRDI